jgi:hypothetical protein
MGEKKLMNKVFETAAKKIKSKDMFRHHGPTLHNFFSCVNIQSFFPHQTA